MEVIRTVASMISIGFLKHKSSCLLKRHAILHIIQNLAEQPTDQMRCKRPCSTLQEPIPPTLKCPSLRALRRLTHRAPWARRLSREAQLPSRWARNIDGPTFPNFPAFTSPISSGSSGGRSSSWRLASGRWPFSVRMLVAAMLATSLQLWCAARVSFYLCRCARQELSTVTS